MKRFHVNVSVGDLARSTSYYSTLFGVSPSVLEDDYAKWMLDDPRVNFSISTATNSRGINHLGLQVDTLDELAEIQGRLRTAGEQTVDQPDAECCYTRSSKTWVRDPDDVAWETIVTHGGITHYGDDRVPEDAESATARNGCCGAASTASCCI